MVRIALCASSAMSGQECGRARSTMICEYLTGEVEARWDHRLVLRQEREAADEWHSSLCRDESSSALLQASCPPPRAALYLQVGRSGLARHKNILSKWASAQRTDLELADLRSFASDLRWRTSSSA